MSVLSAPVPLAWSTPLSFSPSSASATRRKGRLLTSGGKRPGFRENREEGSSYLSSSASSSSTAVSPNEPLTPPPDSPLNTTSHTLFFPSAFSSSPRQPTTFLELALDSSALPAPLAPKPKNGQGRRRARTRSLSPSSSSSISLWTSTREDGGNEAGRKGRVSRRERTRLPEGWEHIPWISSSSSSEEDDFGLLFQGRKQEREDDERPPSPPQTPSPRLFDHDPIFDAPPRLERHGRTVTRSDLPTLRQQLSRSETSRTRGRTGEKSRSAPTSPTKPRCEIVEIEGGDEEKEAERRRRTRKSLKEKSRRASEAIHNAEVAASATPGLGLVVPSSCASTDGTFATRPSSSSSSSITSLPTLSPSCSCDSSDSDEPPTLEDVDHFESHFQSLPLLRLRHALSLAATFAALPRPSASTSTSHSWRAARHFIRPPALSTSRPSPFTRNPIVSEQYRLYAMGRAKAQRTGGVGYWEGGREVRAAVLED